MSATLNLMRVRRREALPWVICDEADQFFNQGESGQQLIIRKPAKFTRPIVIAPGERTMEDEIAAGRLTVTFD